MTQHRDYIYVVGNGQAVKVGMSRKPDARIGSLKTASHLELVPYYMAPVKLGDGERVEAAIHRSLREFHIRGEWFCCTPSTAIDATNDVIKRLRASNPLPSEDEYGIFGLVFRGGYGLIWLSDLDLVHKINLSVIRTIFLGIVFGAAISVGVLVAFILQFFIFSS